MKTLDLRNALIDIKLPGINVEMVEVTQLSVPDPNWHYIDEAGHEHRWVQYTLPTLREVIDIPAVMGCDEEGEFEEIPPITHYECWQCGERIEPGYKSDDSPQYVRGLSRQGDIEIIPKSEKIMEIMEAFNNNEKYEILFFDGLNPIVGRVTKVTMDVTDYIRATIRRTT